MNLLPIVQRELRVAARKRSTFWLRVAASITAVVLAGGCVIMGQLQGVSGAQMGRMLFYALTWTCLAAALSAGLFFTSDCLSEEKREGTLGCLFLTDLRGYDVVSGKLLATSLRGFYSLLAFLPILAVTQIIGGVTVAQYWKSSLALVNALFFSLAAGMFISSISRDSQKALAGTLLALLALGLGGPIADVIIESTTKRGFQPVWSRASPGYVLWAASAWSRSSYWSAVVVTQLLSWAMFAFACALVPRTWQERKGKGLEAGRVWSYSWKYGGSGRRAKLRRTLLERQPIAWLACRERWQSLVLWVMAVLMAIGFLAVLGSGVLTGAWIMWNYVGGLFNLMLYLWLTSQACRFLFEARRTGLLELLLATPLNDRAIAGGAWRALLRMFGLPVLMALAVGIAAAALSHLSFQRMASQVGSLTTGMVTNQVGVTTNQGVVSTTMVVVTPTTGTNAPPAVGAPTTSAAQQLAATLIAGAASGLATAGNLLALAWFGMWMGLTSRTANLAVLKTILFVQVIPWFVITFSSSMLAGIILAQSFFRGSANQPAWWLVWWPLLNAALSTVLALSKDVAFIMWSRRKLHSSLRERAGLGAGAPIYARPPPRIPAQA